MTTQRLGTDVETDRSSRHEVTERMGGCCACGASRNASYAYSLELVAMQTDR